MVDDSGEIYKQIRLSKSSKLEKEYLKNFKDFLREQEKEFKEIFGRDMGPEDKIFFQEIYLVSEEQTKQKMIEAMKKANIAPQIIYAFIKTDRILTEENINKIPDIEIEEWNNAIDEYYERINNGENPLEGDQPPKEILDILDEFLKSIYLVVHISRNENIFNFTGEQTTSLFSCLFFSLMKVETNLKSISSLLSSPDTAIDALNISRSIYEIYLGLQYSIHNPSKISSVYNFDFKNLQDTYTERVRKSTLAVESLYEEDESIHKYIYSFLSGFTHTDFHTIKYYLDTSFVANDVLIESAVISILYTTLILYEILKVNEINDSVRTDILIFLRRVKPKLITFYKKYPAIYNEKDYTGYILSRLSRLDVSG